MADQVIGGGAPISQNEYGYWIDAQGGIAATDPQGNPQETPGQRDSPQSKIYYDAEKKLDYNIVDGKKKYISPASGTPDPTGKVAEGPGAAPGGSFFKNRGTWNPDTGSWDTGVNWGNVLSLVVAGVITAGVATELMSGASVAEAGVAPEVASDVTTAVAADTAAGATALAPEAATAAIAEAAPEAAAGGLEAAGAGAEGVVEGGALPTAGLTAGGAGGAEAAGSGGALSTLGKMAANKGVSSLGNALSQASSAAGNTRRANFDTNVQGQSAFETELLNRSKLEAQQRKGALQDVYLASRAQNPSKSPFAYTPPQSANYGAALSGLEQQGMNRLKTAPQYGTDVMPALPPFKPTAPGTLEQVGSIAGPAISTAKSLWDLYNSSQGGA